MELLKWNKELSIDNFVIDKQHIELFDLINKLISNYNSNTNSPIMGEILCELLKYAKKHFKQEEQLLKNINYPRLEEHKEMHMDFIYKLALFSKDMLENNPKVTQEMLNYLVSWAKDHTSKEDIDYKNYMV